MWVGCPYWSLCEPLRSLYWRKNIFLGLVYNATVPEAAYAVRALGVKDALNIDGGGSSAMYINGKYVVLIPSIKTGRLELEGSLHTTVYPVRSPATRIMI